MQTQSLASASLYTKQSFIVGLGVSTSYLLLSFLLIGFKTDQLILVGIFNSCYFLSSITRKFIIGFSIFIVFWILFDYMKALPNYQFNPVHIQDLYFFEKQYFGILDGATRITPNEFWQKHPITILNVLTGFFYLSWVPVPLGFAAFLFFKNRQQFLHFSLTFLLVNIIGFAVYYIYPAAPPWYVQQYGFTFHPQTSGNAAGLLRFDDFFNNPIFKNLYSKGSNVFAAMPSLHSAYPLTVLYYGIINRYKIASIFFAILMVGIWFSAVYNAHHYVADVLAGIICAIVGILFFQKVLLVNASFSRFLSRYQQTIN